ncbi:Alcohol dehydrogenase GroES-like protein [Pseudomonas sp. M47T1]|uniref:zinc-binding dehydrogenase n=1 Tax=unclassified Pseudomonas TaxID=196821 RepID=UPI0002608057|nr:zinc-binding dehydrogenase [Pseudomonas sp. M47T1]EIK93923.1 Alcohol dehydrogenase GroES-like protein [Pseudomonas sp. M47T1]
MRSALHPTFGEPSEVLCLGDSPMPEPGPGQVRIKTLLAPIHNHDLWTVRGNYGYKPTLPAIGGSEAVGVVDALGEGVEGVALGQRFAVAAAHGTWAEYFLAPAKLLVPLPEAIADEAAAQLIAMPLSALMLLEFLQVQRGDFVVQNTANGAVGKTLAMLAAARGIHTINLVRRDAGIGELAELGVGNAVSTAQPGWQDKVRAIVGDAPIRAAVDSVGGTAAGDLLGLLGENGLLVSFGSMTGEPMQISSGDLIFKQVTVKGFWGSTVGASLSVDEKRRLIGELLRLAATGELKLPVEAIFDLADAHLAAAASLQPGRKGKVLLRP